MSQTWRTFSFRYQIVIGDKNVVPTVNYSIWNLLPVKTTILSPPGPCGPLRCTLNSNPCVISITEIINSSVPSADSLKHKTHPLRLVAAQRAPLFHRPPLLAQFPARKQNFPATLGNIGLLGALTTWGKQNKNQNNPKNWNLWLFLPGIDKGKSLLINLSFLFCYDFNCQI